MERVLGCPLCAHPDRQVRFRGKDRLYGGTDAFTLVECTRCGFLYLSPRPDRSEIASYYPSNYLSYSVPIQSEGSWFRRLDRLSGLRRRCSLIAARRGAGRLLDVGCATGDFLGVMRTYPGWEVRGLEPDAAAARQAEKSYGVDVDVGTLAGVRYEKKSFDAVTLWDVLEHVPQPVDELQSIYRLLRPGGVIVCGVPNRDSVDARFFGAHWAGLDVPRHFSVFSIAHLLDAFKRAGFVDSEVIFLSGSVHSFLLSVHFWLNDLQLPRVAHRLALRTLSSPLTRVALLPYMLLLCRLGKGATVIILARKGMGDEVD